MIETIAASALTLAGTFLAAGAKSAAGEAGKSLWESIKKRFTSDAEKETAEEFEKNPTDSRLQGDLEATLNHILENDRVFAEELSTLVEKAQKEVNVTQYKFESGSTGKGNFGNNGVYNEGK